MEKPKQLENPDLENLRSICQDYLDFIDNDAAYSEDNDYDCYIFEAALMAIFGKNVWKFVNNRQP